MDKLLSAAQFYNNELNGRDFHLKAGKKGNTIEFDIRFNSEHFHHLAGLHKLKDLPQVQDNRGYVFNRILNGKITYEDVKKSDFLSEIENRLNNFSEIKEALFGKELMIKSTRGEFNSIQADFMLTKSNKNYGYAHLFLINKDEAITVPVTFIIHPDNSYLKNNPEKWTVLSIEEIKKAEKETQKVSTQPATQKKNEKIANQEAQPQPANNNRVKLTGTLTSAPSIREVKTPTGNVKRADYTITVQTGSRKDTFSIASWGRQAELDSKYLKPGNTVMVEGDFQTGTIQRAGQTLPAFRVNAQQVRYLLPSSTVKATPGKTQQKQQTSNNQAEF